MVPGFFSSSPIYFKGNHMMTQKATIEKEISFSGVGLHSGQNVVCSLKPSTSGEILFSIKNEESFEIRIDPLRIETSFSSILTDGPRKVHTIEHLLAALYVFGVDSIDIELEGSEIPILDGSALPIAEAIDACGIQTLPQKKTYLKVTKPFELEEENASIFVDPNEEFKISYTIEFDHPAIQKQTSDMVVNVENFINEIAPARTFGFLKDVEGLWAQGLARGGSLENAIILDEKGIINGPLRFEDEFVRHKIIDLIGDLSLMGYPLIGYFSAHKAGHSLHLKVVRFLIENPEYYTLV
jgi:UDP-3-O-[3-hydroxymyristoyl] N-acetylglucosamine deacetylase